jgi:hypothetical protein
VKQHPTQTLGQPKRNKIKYQISLITDTGSSKVWV